jgi:hypothetical protein
MIKNTIKSTSRRQWRFREEGSEGSRSANVRDDEQKPHTRLSLRASWHNTTKPTGSGDRVNAAFVHGRFTFLSGEICASRDRRFMRDIPERSTRYNKDPAYSVAVDGYESRSRETRNSQQLMSKLIAPFMETWRVSTQKSADGIVVSGIYLGRRPERGMSGASNELDVAVESDRMSQTSARRGIAFPRSGLSVSVACIVDSDLIRLRPDDSAKRPVRTRMRGVVGRDG